MKIIEHISGVVRDYLPDRGLKIIPDYAMDYFEFIDQYSSTMPAAFIAYDGFNSYTRYENNETVWEHTYRLIINIKRSDLVVEQIKNIRDNLFINNLIDNGQQYSISVYDGRWLPVEKSKSAFEFVIKVVEC